MYLRCSDWLTSAGARNPSRAKLNWLACCLLLLCVGCGAPAATTQPAGDSAAADRPAGTSTPAGVAEEYIDPTTYPGGTHWVQPGDTLYSLAKRYYGDGEQWRKIYTANQRRLKDPSRLEIGTKLIIPP